LILIYQGTRSLNMWDISFKIGSMPTGTLWLAIASLFEPNKKTILYLPTYDDLSTLSWVLPVLSKMAENFNVILKTHHGQTPQN